MKITQVRNATQILEYAGKKFLIDPMLSDKDIWPGFEGTVRSEIRNPMVELPLDISSLLAVDAIIVTHTHPDHWDQAAADIVPEFPAVSIPTIDSPSPIASVVENVLEYVTPVLETPSITPASRGVVALPARAKTVNGFTFAEKSQIVAVIFSVLGASGMLAVFILRKRRS